MCKKLRDKTKEKGEEEIPMQFSSDTDSEKVDVSQEVFQDGEYEPKSPVKLSPKHQKLSSKNEKQE